MSILRTIALFVYLFGYMIVHYATLRRAERALAAGDLDTVEQIVKANIPRWSRGILRVTGARMTVEGQKNIPAGPCVFVGNHRSYYDIPILLTALDAPHGILAKEELEKIPLLNRWMKLLGCVFVKRDDIRASVKALNDATAIVESGRSFVIFPEGTRRPQPLPSEFKSGIWRLMKEFPQVELIPVYIENLHRAMPKGVLLPVPTVCSIRFGAPLEHSPEDLKEDFLERARNAIISLAQP